MYSSVLPIVLFSLERGGECTVMLIATLDFRRPGVLVAAVGITYRIKQTVPDKTQSNFHNTNIPGKARLSGTTAECALNSKIDETVL